jgi:hypothetical protein
MSIIGRHDQTLRASISSISVRTSDFGLSASVRRRYEIAIFIPLVCGVDYSTVAIIVAFIELKFLRTDKEQPYGS